MAGILGDALQTARQFQGLASVEQQMQQQAKQSEQQKIGFEALKRYQETAQDGNPDNDAMTTALIYNPDSAKLAASCFCRLSCIPTCARTFFAASGL